MKKPLYKRWWFWVVIVLIFPFVMAAIQNATGMKPTSMSASVVETATEAPAETAAPATEAPVETEEPIVEAAEAAPLDIKKEYDNEIVSVCKLTLDRFVSDYEISLAPQRWTLANFDEDGAIIALTDVTLSSGESGRAMFVITPIFDGDKMTGATPHFISVGDTVYGDDGYSADFFATIEAAAEAMGG